SAQVGDGAAHRLRHVEELEIDEYLVAALHQPFEQLEVAARHEQLQAELVEARCVAHSLNERARLLRRRHVERHDQPLGARNQRHALRSFCDRGAPILLHYPFIIARWRTSSSCTTASAARCGAWPSSSPRASSASPAPRRACAPCRESPRTSPM